MNPPRPIKAALLTLACCGCASAPVRYYTLMRPTAASSELASAECCKVQVRRVLIPPEADRPELVTRSGDGQAMVLSNENWLAPLRDEIRGALSSQINLKLSERAVIEPAARLHDSVVSVNVTRFEAIPARYALVTADWRIQGVDSPKAASVTCETTARITVESGVSALVHGYQQAIARIADQIALDIVDAGRKPAHRCPTD